VEITGNMRFCTVGGKRMVVLVKHMTHAYFFAIFSILSRKTHGHTLLSTFENSFFSSLLGPWN